jgi:hypothetical protein
MSHQLYVKSLREPIFISKEEAEGIANLMSDQSKDGRTPIIIEGVWTGSKGEVKFVKYPPRESETKQRKQIETMSKVQAEVFEKQVNIHKAEAEAAGFSSFYWKQFYMQSQGVIRVELCEVAKKNGKTLEKEYRLTEVVKDPSRYPKLLEEIESYMQYVSRIEYAKKQKAKELEKMAEEQAGLVEA